jgi:hypothetical protein
MSGIAPILVDQFSIVLTAQFHNPSIINPDFLKGNHIASPDWSVQDTVTTPGYSQTVYDNGIGIVVEEGRMTVRESVGKAFRDFYSSPRVAASYVQTLSHIPYKELGINWLLRTSNDNPRQWLIQRFLNPGKWLESEPAVMSAELKLETTFRLFHEVYGH